MKVAILVFTLFLISCSSKSQNQDSQDEQDLHDFDNTQPDIDTTVPDPDISDDLSDDLSDEVSDTESEDTEPDEIPDIVYPEPTCIEIYEGDPESELCFGPVKTKVKCNAFPKDGEYTIILDEDNPIGSTDKPMDINDDFVFFIIYPKNSEKGSNIYGCNRIDGYLYKIVNSIYDNPQFTVYNNFIVLNIWDGSRESSDRAKLFLGNFKTNEVKEITDWGGYGKIQFKYPFVTYYDYSEKPNILNLETNENTRLDRLTGPFPRNDGKNLVLTGYYKQPGESDDETPFGVGTWIVDMKTNEIKPLNVTASFAEGVVNIDG
ncbi:MAG TPA: hypothetical protein PKM15_03480, partial [bacterium]|nr:hypothetical protein [bacterium]